MKSECAVFSAIYWPDIKRSHRKGVSGWQRLWYRLVKRVPWPKQARFFEDWEKAKDWLIDEIFSY